jgi:hypothetical protein
MSYEPKPCPECKSTDLDIDSTWCASWVQCCDCEFKLQHECSETAIVKRWNKLERIVIIVKCSCGKRDKNKCSKENGLNSGKMCLIGDV